MEPIALATIDDCGAYWRWTVRSGEAVLATGTEVYYADARLSALYWGMDNGHDVCL